MDSSFPSSPWAADLDVDTANEVDEVTPLLL
jgi:hypothetical protein